MSEFNGRRAPNFTQYLNDLNTIQPAYDQGLRQEQELFDVDAELALFTNAEFLDFDPAGDMSANARPVKFREEQTSSESSPAQEVNYLDMLNDFNIPNYPYYSSSIVPMQSSAVYPPAQTSTTAANDSSINPSIPSLVPQHSPIAPQNQSLATAAGPKRKPEPPTLDEPGRLAQEEDKRRRNTAASARFRIKKKEREKNLERTVKDITTKNSNLEARVNQLEMENRWLKNLITEKNGSVLSDGDLSGMFHKYRESNEGTPQQQGSTSSSNGSESR